MTDTKMVSPRERPMLFSPPMVQANREGRKRTTRRIVKPQPIDFTGLDNADCPANWLLPHAPRKRSITWKRVGPKAKDLWFDELDDLRAYLLEHVCPWRVGDVIWTRERWAVAECYDKIKPSLLNLDQRNIWYYADDGKADQPGADAVRGKWRQSIHMCRRMSRDRYRINDIRVEQVQEIGEYDAQLEGVIPRWPNDVPIVHDGTGGVYIEAFRDLWNTINTGRGFGWPLNPFVFVYSYEDM